MAIGLPRDGSGNGRHRAALATLSYVGTGYTTALFAARAIMAPLGGKISDTLVKRSGQKMGRGRRHDEHRRATSEDF